MRTARAGHTLGEMLIVMTLMTVLLPSALQTVRRVMIATRRSNESLELIRISRSLSYQWRLDVHRATTAEIDTTPAGNSRLRLVAPGGDRTEYELLSADVVRRVIQQDGVIQEESYSRSLSSVAATSDVEREVPALWTAGWTKSGSTLHLTLDAMPAEYQAGNEVAATNHSVHTKRVTNIVATLGRDHRHDQQ